MKKILRSLGYGYIQTKGGYVERANDDDPGVDVVDELSVMVPNITEKDALRIGQIDLGHGPQDTILYCDGKDFLGYLNTNDKYGPIGEVTLEFEYGKDGDTYLWVKMLLNNIFRFYLKVFIRVENFLSYQKQMNLLCYLK